MSAMAAGTALRLGLRCSSIGVPITTTTCSTSPITSGELEARRWPDSTTAERTSGAPGSSKGIVPALTIATDRSLRS